MKLRRSEHVEELPRSSEAAFDLVHDYGRRLEWDTLLREAYIDGGEAPGVGAVAVCTGRWWLGGLCFRTAYVSFRRGEVAAVKLVNRPPFFERWAASIRHEPLGAQRSRIVYTISFSARPRWLAWLLEPVIDLAFRIETRRRLSALRDALAQQAGRAGRR